MNLREYQNRTISKLREHISNGIKKLIMCAPTGAGKTVMFSFMLKTAIGRGKKCMVLTHRTELLLQAGGILSGIGCEVINLDAKMKTIKIITTSLILLLLNACQSEQERQQSIKDNQ
jgi:type I site-specific restriction endonuclease